MGDEWIGGKGAGDGWEGLLAGERGAWVSASWRWRLGLLRGFDVSG